MMLNKNQCEELVGVIKMMVLSILHFYSFKKMIKLKLTKYTFAVFGFSIKILTKYILIVLLGQIYSRYHIFGQILSLTEELKST